MKKHCSWLVPMVLTGLFNYRQFKRILSQEVIRSQKYASEMTLVMFDVDNFKYFNDRYGHPCGDRILAKVAELLREIFREADLVFRYGGEEFVAILPNSGPKEALVAAERARDSIASMRIACQDGDLSLGVTVSVGVASLPQDANSEEALLQVADHLMYQAKHQGKKPGSCHAKSWALIEGDFILTACYRGLFRLC